MKTITASNQSLQYLYSVVADSQTPTIAMIRTARTILKKAFPVVTAYELAKREPIAEASKIGKQLDMIVQAGKADAQAEVMKDLQEKHKDIIENIVTPMAETIVTLELEEDEIDFVLNEMNEFLAVAKKVNTIEEMKHFDDLYTALESAK